MTKVLKKLLGLPFFKILSLLLLCQYLGLLKAENVTLDDSLSLQEQILKEVNHFRELHSVYPLKLDDELSKAASKWALLLHKKGKKDGVLKTWYAHPKNQGECVYTEANSQNPEDTADHIHKAVISWYCEMTKFNFSQRRFREDTAQFSQMVWKETERVGFASALNFGTGDVAIVARFAPQGNWHYLEDFRKNIHEPSSYEATKECPGQKPHAVEPTNPQDLGRSLSVPTTTESERVTTTDKDLGGSLSESTTETMKETTTVKGFGRSLSAPVTEAAKPSTTTTTTAVPKKKAKRRLGGDVKKAKTMTPDDE